MVDDKVNNILMRKPGNLIIESQVMNNSFQRRICVMFGGADLYKR